MINLTILSGFLLDLSYGHGYLAMKETRNANPPKKEKFNETWDDDRIATMRRTWRKSHRTSYRTELNTGAPCGGRGLVGFAETELPSMDGPSSDFGGARVSVRVGSTIEMPIKMTANHGGFHFAAAYCSEGKEPTAKSFIPNMPEGWKVLKLAQGDAWKQKLNGPKFPFNARGIPDEDKIKFLECDAYIPHKYPTYHPIKLYYDIPEDLCEGAETKEAIISWIWESDLRLAPLNPDRYTKTDNNCRPVFYENRCGQNTLDTFATDFWQQKKACDEYGEVWYNCFDAKVATDGETDEQQGIPMMTATTASTTAGEITAEKTLKEMEPEAGCMAYDYLQYISTMDESVLAKIFEAIEGDQKERDGQEGTEEDEDAPESLTEFEGLLKMFVGQVREKCSMWLGEDCFEDLLESKFVEYIRENDAFMRSLNFPADAAEGEFEQKTKDFINHIHATNGTIMCGGTTDAAANSTTPPKTPVTASDSCAIQSGRGCSEVEKCVKVEDKDQNAEHKCIRVDEWQENHLCKPSRGYRRIDKKRRGNRATPKTCKKYCMQKRNRNKDINGVGFYPNQNGQWRCLCFKGDVTLTKRDLHYPKNKDAICMILNSSRGQQPK